MRIDILTLFPEMCEAFLGDSIIGRARKKGALQICCHQIRDYALDKHKRVDDCPFGGGFGMLMIAEPIALCMDDIIYTLGRKPHTVFMSPAGAPLTQEKVLELSKYPELAVICGHYEGVDERVLEMYADELVSVGDFVVTGGEMPAMMMTDAVARMLPGVLSDELCFEEESHFSGLLEYPQYSRPALWRGMEVPPVILSGDHKKVDDFRRLQSLLRTKELRPDMYEKYELTESDKKLLRKFENKQ